MEEFPFPFNRRGDPASPAFIENYARKLRYERDQALENPLVAGCSFSCLFVPPKCPSHTAATRPLPWFAKTESALSCELQRPLKTGVDIWSQVWVARVIPRSVDADVDPSLSLVVLKFIQPSLLRIPDELSVYVSEYQVPEKVAKSEAFIYAQLEPLQGDVIPYFFGIQTVVTPSGESAWVLMIEYINGCTFRDHFKKVSKQDGWETDPKVFDETCRLYKSALDSSWAMCRNSVFYIDRSDTNMMVLGDRIVIIDFAQSNLLSGPHLIVADQDNLNVLFLDSFGYLDRLIRCVADELDPEILKNLKKAYPLF